MSSKNDLPTKRNSDEGPTDGPAVVDDRSGSLRDRRVGRRTFVKGLGATAAIAVGSNRIGSPVGNAQAIAPLVAAGVIGASVVTGWALREFQVVGSDPPAEGLTESVLKNQIYEKALARRSNNKSTIVDNGNILDGVKHTAYTEAKIAAIEGLNAGKSESAVLSDSTLAIDAYETTIRKNLYSTWNEGVREFYSMISALESHPNLDADGLGVLGLSDETSVERWETINTNTITLPDGTSFDIVGPAFYRSGNSGSGTGSWDPTQKTNAYDTYGAEHVAVKSGDGLDYLKYSEWNAIETKMDTVFSNVRDGISTWVTNVYGSVQSGDIAITDLVTPAERAAMTAEGEETPRAIADLIALNVSVDLEREATITHGSTGAQLTGTFGLTDETDGPLVAGDTYDASTFTGDVYFTTDLSLMEGEWTAINTSVDGGVFTITSEPYEATLVEVTTTAGETVAVPAADWTAGSTSGEWTYDASGDLETNITEVSSARFVAASDEVNYETLNLSGSFTVESMTDSSGESVGQTSFSSSEPQNDSNYITQKEWDDLEQQNEELIQKYEDSQSNGGGLDLSGLDMFGMPGELVALAGAAVAAFLATNN